MESNARPIVYPGEQAHATRKVIKERILTKYVALLEKCYS